MARPAAEPLKVSATIMSEGVVAVECSRCGPLVTAESRQDSLNYSKAHVIEHGAKPKFEESTWPK